MALPTLREQAEAQVPVGKDSIQAIINRIDAIGNRLQQHNSDLFGLSERYFGKAPPSGSADGPRPAEVRSGAIGEVHNALDEVETALDTLAKLESRLSAIA